MSKSLSWADIQEEEEEKEHLQFQNEEKQEIVKDSLFSFSENSILLFSDAWDWGKLTFVKMVEGERALYTEAVKAGYRYYHGFKIANKTILTANRKRPMTFYNQFAAPIYIQNLERFIPTDLSNQIYDYYEKQKQNSIQKRDNMKISKSQRVANQLKLQSTQNANLNMFNAFASLNDDDTNDD